MYLLVFLQSNRISKLESVQYRYLFEHVGLYTFTFIILSPLLLGLTIKEGIEYSLLNGLLHLVVDYITGKFKSKFRESHDFKYNMMIGIDYSVHLMILITTYIYFFPQAMHVVTFWDKG